MDDDGQFEASVPSFDENEENDTNELEALPATVVAEPNTFTAIAPEEIVDEPSSASAPPPESDTTILRAAVAAVTVPKVEYPNLQSVLDALPQLTATTAAVHVVEQLRPFSALQLAELYANPEIEIVHRFENEFIQTELSANYKAHPLYELLTRYSRTRHNLKMNAADLQKYRSDMEAASAKVWTREIRTVKYSGHCNDGVLVHDSQNYE